MAYSRLICYVPNSPLAKTDGLKCIGVGLHLILIEPLTNGRAVISQKLDKCICIMVEVWQSVVISIVIQGRLI